MAAFGSGPPVAPAAEKARPVLPEEGTYLIHSYLQLTVIMPRCVLAHWGPDKFIIVGDGFEYLIKDIEPGGKCKALTTLANNNDHEDINEPIDCVMEISADPRMLSVQITGRGGKDRCLVNARRIGASM